MKTPLAQSIDMASRHADRLMGIKASHYHKPVWTFNVETGAQTLSGSPKAVTLRRWPMTYKDCIDLSHMGITDIDVRWTMRAKYAALVEPGDLFIVAGFTYVVAEMGTSIDEHGVDWTILARRRRE